MPGIDDKIVVRFHPGLIVKIREVISKFKGLARTMRMGDTHDFVQLTIWLDRPDTLKEEGIESYVSSAHSLENELREIGCELIQLEIAEFNLPAMSP